VRHTFRHFHLGRAVSVAEFDVATEQRRGAFLPRGAFRPSDLPTVMRKAWDIAAGALNAA
jgi:A/G-specific adenine glycosylase